MTVVSDHLESTASTELIALDRGQERSVLRRVPGTRFFWLWVLVASIAVGACALSWPSAHIAANAAVGLEAEYLPVSIDSFYHARRILDTAADPASFYQFDAKIHAPEGSLLPWPWGYDYAMGWIVRTGNCWVCQAHRSSSSSGFLSSPSCCPSD